jgi:plasmid stabilization system protein ParE
MKTYVLAEAVASDLDAIWDRIAADKPDAADRWIARLFSAFEKLARNPALGHTRKDLTNHSVLFWSIEAYLIVYRDQPEFVEIVAVTQGSRDIPIFLSQRTSRS